jgi:hypothetical protein
MARPRAISNLALILTLIGISGLGGIASAPWGRPIPVAPQLLGADPVTTAWLILSTGALYVAATVICAFSLWRMLPWAPTAYRCFVASIALFMFVWLYLIRIPMPIALGIAFFALLGSGLYWGWRIVRRAFEPSAHAL